VPLRRCQGANDFNLISRFKLLAQGPNDLFCIDLSGGRMLTTPEHEGLDGDRGNIATVESIAAGVPTLANQPDWSDDSGRLGPDPGFGLEHPLGQLHLTHRTQGSPPKGCVIEGICLRPIGVDATSTYDGGRGMIGSLAMRSVPVRYSEVVSGR